MLYAAGWPIIQQGQRGGAPSPNGYATDQSGMAADIQQARSQLISCGYGLDLDIMTYAYNARSGASDTVAAANGIVMAGSSGNELIRSSEGKQNPLALGRYSTQNGNTASQMLAAVDVCIASGRSLWLFGHDFVSGTITDTSVQTPQSEMTAFVAGLKTRFDAGQCLVGTPGDLKRRWGI